MMSPTLAEQVTHRRPRATLGMLRILLLIHPVLVVAQPILAGYFLAGEVDAMDWYGPIGSSLFLIALIQLVAAILYWRPGGGRLWPALVTLGLIVAELTQVIFGYAQNFAVRVPLGTAIVWMTVWSFRSSARRGRREVAQ